MKSTIPSIFLTDQFLNDLTKIERKNYALRLKLVKAIIENNGMTNAAVCNELMISAPKSLNLINGLIEQGILEQNEKANSIGGRKPVLNKLKDHTLYIVCAEIERFKLKISILDNNNNKATDTASFSFSLSKNQASVNQLEELISGYIEQSGLNPHRIIGIGIQMPGLIDYREGKNFTYMVGDRRNVSLRDQLSEHFNKPVFIVNDVKSSAIAELKFGLAKDKKDVLVILMDWGIGLGIIMDGKLRNGFSGFSGEMGHMPFVDDGALCYCGKKGCLETVASGIALARMAKEGIQSGQDSLLNKLSDQEIDKIEPQLVIDAANLGDQYAISILSYIGEKLGKGIAILLQLFNPELIILSGKIAEAKQYITIPIQQAINTYSMTEIRERVAVELSQLGADAGTMGIARMFFEEFFNEQIAKVDKNL
ncbi:ROK family protein (putative glucokinase) [bacterium A37T11]|nr:ROK family protein (putative glucokinase) [bacterium A37T11]